MNMSVWNAPSTWSAALLVRPQPGEITEVVGRLGSGRTSVLIRWLGDVTCAGRAAALVDTDDTFDATTAAHAGIDLRRLLWVRCGGRRDVALRATDLLVHCPGFALIALDTGEVAPRLPLTAAFRLKLAARCADTALVILGRRRIAGSSATVAIETAREALLWSGSGSRHTVLAGMRTCLHLVRRQGAGHGRGRSRALTLGA
jgi:recA bacterial DNA recombination protein